MEFKVNENITMNMQSINCNVYNEGLFTIPYRNASDGASKVEVWHAGIVSYIILDFHSKETVEGYPKYITDHGHLPIAFQKANFEGTLKDLGDNNDLLKRTGLVPERPLSFFEVYNPNNVNTINTLEDVIKTYRDIFKEKNRSELDEKLYRTYMRILAAREKAADSSDLKLKETFLHGEDDRMVVIYGQVGHIFEDEAAKRLNLKDGKIYDSSNLEGAVRDKI